MTPVPLPFGSIQSEHNDSEVDGRSDYCSRGSWGRLCLAPYGTGAALRRTGMQRTDGFSIILPLFHNRATGSDGVPGVNAIMVAPTCP